MQIAFLAAIYVLSISEVEDSPGACFSGDLSGHQVRLDHFVDGEPCNGRELVACDG